MQTGEAACTAGPAAVVDKNTAGQTRVPNHHQTAGFAARPARAAVAGIQTMRRVAQAAVAARPTLTGPVVEKGKPLKEIDVKGIHTAAGAARPAHSTRTGAAAFVKRGIQGIAARAAAPACACLVALEQNLAHDIGIGDHVEAAPTAAWAAMPAHCPTGRRIRLAAIAAAPGLVVADLQVLQQAG